MNRYILEEHEHGLLVLGDPPPVTVFVGLGNIAQELGFDLSDAGVANAYTARFAFTNALSGPLWRAEIDKRNAPRMLPLAAWLAGADVGTSAQTIAHVLGTSSDLGFGLGPGVPLPSWGPTIPLDASDFGRCLRLVQLMDNRVAPPGWTAWRDRLDEVAERYPAWVPIVKAWDTLAALYDTEDHPLLYKHLKEMR